MISVRPEAGVIQWKNASFSFPLVISMGYIDTVHNIVHFREQL